MSTTLQLSFLNAPLPVTLGTGIDLDEEALLSFPAFKKWLQSLEINLSRQGTPGHTFEADPWRLSKVAIHNVTIFPNGKIGFMTIEGFLRRGDGQGGGNVLDRVVFLRGGSVAILMILRPKDSHNERYVILVEQPRIGACSTCFLEIPAGMLDEQSGNVKGKAIDEIYEETNLTVKTEELIDLTKLALDDVEPKEFLQPGIYPSPANLDEYIPLLLWEKELDRKEIEALRGKLTGQRAQDEVITLRVCEYEELWRAGARDAKTLAAWALYEGLNRSGKIGEKLHEIRTGMYEQ